METTSLRGKKMTYTLTYYYYIPIIDDFKNIFNTGIIRFEYIYIVYNKKHFDC